jgi:leucyl/phenylalanyl-tRNA--protein transferase
MTSPTAIWINAGDPPESFPDIESAIDGLDGLLAAGGDLSEQRLIYAYRHGIFPWYSDGYPILWWSPDPRCILRPAEFHVSRSLRRTLLQSDFDIAFNHAFGDVITACAEARVGQDGTWITADMTAAYLHLHRQGWAHSVEVYSGDKLVGGLYGLAIGRAFFGESMFSRLSDASKTAMLAVCRHLTANGFEVFDCQVESPHLLSLGATLLPREEFALLLSRACRDAAQFRDWPADRRRAETFLKPVD